MQSSDDSSFHINKSTNYYDPGKSRSLVNLQNRRDSHILTAYLIETIRETSREKLSTPKDLHDNGELWADS